MSPPPRAEHKRRTIEGAFFVFWHIPLHFPHAEHQNAPHGTFFSLVRTFLTQTRKMRPCVAFFVFVSCCHLANLPNTSHCCHQPTTSPTLQQMTMTATMEERGQAYMVRP